MEWSSFTLIEQETKARQKTRFSLSKEQFTSKQDGTLISNKVIKSHLKDILENENKKKPYSDEELSEKLDEVGFHIARRTVAKYRDQIGVPVARLRREL